MSTVAPTAPLRSPPIRLSRHCAERYQERFKPALDPGGARDDLLRLLGCGRIVTAPPEWMARTQATFTDHYLVIGDDLVLPLRRLRDGFIAVTCLGRGCISEAAREHRNRRRRRRR